MKGKNVNRIVWLEDQKSSITGLTEYLQTQGDFSITIFEKSTDALTALLDEDPDLFIVNLLLDESDGLSIAKTAHVMKPSIPIVAVTEYLIRFARHIVLDLVERTYLSLQSMRKASWSPWRLRGCLQQNFAAFVNPVA